MTTPFGGRKDPSKAAVRVMSLDEFKANAANHRNHDNRNMKAIGDSIDQFGPGRSIVAGPNGVIYAGNGTLEQAKARGMKALVVRPQRDQIVVVDRSDLSITEATALGIADNRSTDLSTNNDATLAQLLESLPEELQGAAGYDADELADLLDSLEKTSGYGGGSGPGPGNDAETPEPAPPDRHAELLAKWEVEPGQKWLIRSGSVPGAYHRVFCGDSTVYSDMAHLCDGETAQIAVTSPPYAEQRKDSYGGVKADEYVEWFKPVQFNVRQFLTQHGSFFVNIKAHVEDGERHLYVLDLVSAMRRAWSWRYVDELIWTHQGFPGKFVGRFKNGFEPIHHFAKGFPIKFNPDAVGHASSEVPRYAPGDNQERYIARGGIQCSAEEGDGIARPSNVLRIMQGQRNTAGIAHSAAFPLELPEFFILAFTDPGDVVLDPFAGSGTTIFAAEKHGRIGMGLERLPAHVAVILERAAEMGLEPVRE